MTSSWNASSGTRRSATWEPGRMFKIIDEASGEAVGSVGYWDRDVGDETRL